MFSEAGKTFDRSKTVRPLSKQQRERMYASTEVKMDPKIGEKKFSPFNTISRTSRNSYLLRVTNEPNTQTNYEPDYRKTLSLERRSTIDKAEFQRIIGPVNKNSYKKEGPPSRDDRCVKAAKPFLNHRPLTVSETHRWRKTHENLDFQKQPETNRTNVHDYLKTMKTTKDEFLIKTLQETTQSNFNNYKRFSFRSQKEKSHSFRSNTGHKYLERVQNREIQPEYDVQACKEEITRKSMGKAKGQLRFYLNREKIKTRVDRSDPNWVQVLDYNPEKITTLDNRKTIDFNLITERQINEVQSKYPLRQSIELFPPRNK